MGQIIATRIDDEFTEGYIHGRKYHFISLEDGDYFAKPSGKSRVAYILVNWLDSEKTKAEVVKVTNRDILNGLNRLVGLYEKLPEIKEEQDIKHDVFLRINKIEKRKELLREQARQLFGDGSLSDGLETLAFPDSEEAPKRKGLYNTTESEEDV